MYLCRRSLRHLINKEYNLLFCSIKMLLTFKRHLLEKYLNSIQGFQKYYNVYLSTYEAMHGRQYKSKSALFIIVYFCKMTV